MQNNSRRIYITLPQSYRQDLDEMAHRAGETTTAYAGYLLRLRIEDWRVENRAKQLLLEAQAASGNNLLKSFVNALSNRCQLSEGELEEIAQIADLPYRELVAIAHSIQTKKELLASK